MTTDNSPSGKPRLGPHCRALRRGVIGDALDGRSREGRFLRKCEAELVARVGGSPSFAQTLLIRRIARATLKLEMFDAKMSANCGQTTTPGPRRDQQFAAAHAEGDWNYGRRQEAADDRRVPAARKADRD